MNGKQHITYGILLALVFSISYQLITRQFLGIIQNLLVIPVGYFFSLLPDVDHKMSTITWQLLGCSFTGMAYGYLKGDDKFMLISFGIGMVTFLSANFMKHRSISHSLVWVIVSPLLLLFVGGGLFLMLVAGVAYWSHLLCDKIPLKISFKSWSPLENNWFRAF